MSPELFVQLMAAVARDSLNQARVIEQQAREIERLRAALQAKEK